VARCSFPAHISAGREEGRKKGRKEERKKGRKEERKKGRKEGEQGASPLPPKYICL